ncbi:hypothetical protein VM98_07195 [Streptomyces rubellomurinus subsp. indigoferus]|uniref:Secreted protein n=1 Tax=Streptomyces rubellomurinus (strain ATCC 31215) TaxID=359131 RepID=A0A0F2TEZ0_STRR3|nr:hypothetical protein [Streptomyces rubellomurinus]KJS56451.1 hypothetical protein VM98_07195 [Streptomyces rubellomurinus subsp. indigoferus]KJS61768.1 hypothetical protein VM95_13095 [Streptomyces rubellomurinus]
MRNGLVQLGAWAAATGAAVALSWLGVHAVLAGAAFEQPTALPLPSPKATVVPRAATATPDRARPADQPEASSSAAAPSAPASRTPAPSAPPTAPPPTRRPTPTATATPTVKSYPIPGGRVALDLRPDRASLVSATPDPGWQMQVWNGEGWLRVDFTKDDKANSVFVAWNGHAPTVETAIR